MAYDLGVVGDVVACLNRASKPGVGPGAGVGNRLSFGGGVTPIVLGLHLVIHVGPKRVARAERTRLPLERRGVVLILGILNVDLGIARKRRGGSGNGLRLALLRGDRCCRRRVLGVGGVIG